VAWSFKRQSVVRRMLLGTMPSKVVGASMLSAKASSPLALVSPLYLHRAFTWLLYLVTDQSLA
jgi:hypothetical protein